jgi:hypothetical protein
MVSRRGAQENKGLRLSPTKKRVNAAQHWAHDLGLNRKFEDWTPEFGWWLEKRIRTIEGFATPTGVVKR